MSTKLSKTPQDVKGEKQLICIREGEGFTSNASILDFPFEVWEVIGKHMCKHSTVSLLAFRQTCTTAKTLVDNLPNFCEDVRINLDPKNFNRFLEMKWITLPLSNFCLRHPYRLSRVQLFPAFTYVWAERITSIHLQKIQLYSNSPMIEFWNSLTSLRDLKVDKIEVGPFCNQNIRTNLPLSLFANLLTLNIGNWDVPDCHLNNLEPLEEAESNLNLVNSEEASEDIDDSTDSEFEDVPMSKPADILKLKSSRNFTLFEYCYHLFKTLKENEKLSHLSLNLMNIPIEYVSSLIVHKRDTPMTFRFLVEEQMRYLSEPKFIRAVAASKNKVRIVYDSAPYEAFQELMLIFQTELEVAQSFFMTVECIATTCILRDILPLTTPNLKGVMIDGKHESVEFPDSVEEVFYTAWGNESEIDKYFTTWPVALKTLNSSICHMMDFQWNNVLTALATGCPNLSSLVVSLHSGNNTDRAFISDKVEDAEESNLLRRLTNLKNLKLIVGCFGKPVGITDEIMQLISNSSVQRLEISIDIQNIQDNEGILTGTNITAEGLDMLRTGAISNRLLKFVLEVRKGIKVSKSVQLSVEKIKQVTILNRRSASAEEINNLRRNPFILPQL